MQSLQCKVQTLMKCKDCKKCERCKDGISKACKISSGYFKDCYKIHENCRYCLEYMKIRKKRFIF